jgi:chemotaxis protein CheZ
MVSTGLMIKAREEAPQKDIKGLREEGQSKASDLQGPTEESSQGDVDDLLASLGMD